LICPLQKQLEGLKETAEYMVEKAKEAETEEQKLQEQIKEAEADEQTPQEKLAIGQEERLKLRDHRITLNKRAKVCGKILQALELVSSSGEARDKAFEEAKVVIQADKEARKKAAQLDNSYKPIYVAVDLFIEECYQFFCTGKVNFSGKALAAPYQPASVDSAGPCSSLCCLSWPLHLTADNVNLGAVCS
jgi:hypothetical protein